MKKTFCDICGEEVDHNITEIRQKRLYPGRTYPDYDLCFSCARHIYEMIRQMKEAE